MTKAKLFISRKIPDAGLILLNNEFEIDIWPQYAPPSREELTKHLESADAMLSLLSDKIDAEVMRSAPNLKIIAQYAVGYDNIDISEATRRGILVTNTPEVLTDASADFSWALLMAVARRVVEADRYVKNGSWKVAWHPEMMLGKEVTGSTIGIIGAGRIGQAMARRATGFSMKILYYSGSPKPEFERETGAIRVDLPELLRQSDFVSLHVPLTDQTRAIINAENIALMKPDAFLINNARGPVVDEQALYQALKNRKIAGAGLDVFVQEPTPADNPLLQLDNVIVAPHVSSASFAARDKMAILAAENLLAWRTGKSPANLVNK